MTNNTKDTKVENLLSELADYRDRLSADYENLMHYVAECVKSYTLYSDTVISGAFIGFGAGAYSLDVDLKTKKFKLVGKVCLDSGLYAEEITVEAPLTDKYLRRALSLTVSEEKRVEEPYEEVIIFWSNMTYMKVDLDKDKKLSLKNQWMLDIKMARARGEIKAGLLNNNGYFVISLNELEKRIEELCE